MKPKRKSTVGKVPTSPLDTIIPENPQPEPKRKRDGLYIRTDPGLLDRLRAAAYWQREKVTEIVTRAIERELALMEKKNGEPFQPVPKR